MPRKKVSQETLESPRGVASFDEAKAWVATRNIDDVECIVPDQSGVARGKLMPASKFFEGRVMNMPESIFYQTISGDYPKLDGLAGLDPADGDLLFRPDFATLCIVPWEEEPTAQVIHDAYHSDGRVVELAPRQVLRRVIKLFENRGWKPVVAPEVEFYLVRPNTDPDYPLEPPIGRSGRPETGRKSFSISAVNEFDPLFDDIYDYSEAQGLEIDTLIHEEGAAQMEINLRHGDPLELADQVFLFKRTIREAALKHNTYATFMAKPIAQEPGSAMHIHQSIVDAKTGRNIFSDADGEPTTEFFSFIAGLQEYLPAAMCMLAPYVNSYRRLARYTAAPINIQWGHDNRTVGLRIPRSKPDARRVENRVPSSDANPYLAIAASLACGWLGIQKGLTPSDPIKGSARDLPYDLPRGLLEAVAAFQECEPMREVFGETFVSVYSALKQEEFETFMRVISPWEREYLLLNV
ncbi:glutamine synthetase family protein [Microbaculum marinisediminis]|uniref:Glutamine synthetase family protein n=1 Tax=Microbaculum marinisediminis TaxID=2931392 RepID=A0AAW5QQZ3_9HYPH|nr:glutamine synthetase family protein [Microbaculum sp. A6E488]MCT8970496.1 glutamine synthetase family protein [Microbaculum sp. A6E488]